MMWTDRHDDSQQDDRHQSTRTISDTARSTPLHASDRSSPRGRLSRIQLYCLPHAGGTAHIFRRWPTLLRADIDIRALDYPGHGRRIGQPVLDTIERIARSVSDEIMSRSHDRPYALFGHSMGSLVAFETCHVLAARKVAMPSLLIACGHRAPRLPRSSPAMADAPHSEFVAHLRELGATPPELFSAPDLLELILPVLRTDFRACESYTPPHRPRLPVPMVVYGGLGDEDTSRDTLQAWQQETTGTCTVRMFPGGHFFINDRANQVISALERDLRDALATEPIAPCAAMR
jgi:medium-chain acyl-[acyl-carrier-protein] hydrolase